MTHLQGDPPEARVRASTRIDAVQLLRAVAAVLVVIGHAQTSAATTGALHGAAFQRLTLLPWGAGVDLFFVISGFIMVYASQRLFGAPGASGEFLRRRLTRVAPLYWLCTAAYVAILLLAHLRGDPRAPEPAWVAASFAFLPYLRPDGAGAFPVFDLGWTLNYEVFFYLLFAAALVLPRRRAVGLVLAALTALTVAGVIARPSATALRFWTQPILMDFAFGVAVGALRCEGVRLSAGVRVALACVGAALLALDPLGVFSGAAPGTTVGNGWARVLAAGAPAAGLLAAASLGPDVRDRRLGPAVALGNVSYSLYLVHPFVLIAMEKLAVRTGVFDRVGYGWMAVLAIAASLALAFLVFHLVEQPVTRAAGRLTRPGSRRPSGRPPAGSSSSNPSMAAAP